MIPSALALPAVLAGLLAGLLIIRMSERRREKSRSPDTGRPTRAAIRSEPPRSWRDVKSSDVIGDGDRIRNPYDEELAILDYHDGRKVLFGDGDTWTVSAMSEATGWHILESGGGICAEPGFRVSTTTKAPEPS